MYEELVKRLRSAESNYQETLDCLSEAADAIEELMRRCEQFQYMPPPAWIPVTERLPESGERVLVSNGKGFVCEAYLSERKRWMRHGCIVDYITPTHWMPLPSTEGLNEA